MAEPAKREITPEIKQILQALEFDEKWLILGIISSEKLEDLWSGFQNSDDKSKEHYRWRAFTNYLKDKKEIGEDILRELYRLGEIDADHHGIGTSTRVEILSRNDCPADLIDKALNSKEKILVKISRKKLGLVINQK